ncbi:Glycosyltransferase involved in cell wall bisynthesis [Pseudobutyrivibrio sp. YE44]|uniref:glycosyltransferase family 2 protein n=1 Tax=Pseudobutyrivibrio sp. YE44 TaxID=1520802 RepID=UPI0008827562|nr:glycosyltransferase [Pseudobutyrivibrio sp. YE44]SDB29087.1 Glycosyltransferase involved in cell wall bisynthesis [Pseudobutyrivibrio sp. YE44]
MRPKVSIIMPSLNVADYIGEAIKSAREQTIRDIEIISVDAGSTDGTVDIISKAVAKDDRIIALQSPIKSYGFQVNMGIEKAIGEYIAILETDDFISLDMCEILYKIASKEDLDYVKSDYDAYITDAYGERVFTRRNITDNKLFYQSVFVPMEHPIEMSNDSYLWNGIYKTSFLKEKRIRFSETSGAAFQDVGFLHRVKAVAKRVRYVDQSLYRYCTDRDGASSNTGKSLIYLRQEYGFLVDAISCDDEKRLLYTRMARAFCRACMESAEDFLESVQGREILTWFVDLLHMASCDGHVSYETLPDALKMTYKSVTDSIDKYVELRKNRKYEFKKFLTEGSPIIIFGCGIYGREAERYIREIGFKAEYFMDNAESTWNTTVNGITVVSPNKLVELTSDARVIVANEKHGQEIYEQIKKMNSKVKVIFY